MTAPRPESLFRLRLTVLLVLGAGASVLLGLLLYPFLPALVTSAVLATLSYPAHRKLKRWVRQEEIAAFITTTVVFFLVLLPVVGLSIMLIDQVRQGVEWLRGVVEGITAPGGFLTRAMEYLSVYLGVEAERATGPVADELSRFLGLLARRTLGFLSGIGGWLLQAGAALFTLFYFIRDADGLMASVKWLIPLDEQATEDLIRRTRDVIFATVFGNVAVAIVQGTLGGLAFWALGLPAAALWGTVMGVLSLLPVVGPVFVWLPAALILLAEREILRGVLLLAVGAGLVSMVDNYLRAVLIGGRAQLHSLVVFFSVLAGLFAFGAVGIFVGPVLFVIAFCILELARAALDGAPGVAGLLPAEGGAPAAGAAPQGIFRPGPRRPPRRFRWKGGGKWRSAELPEGSREEAPEGSREEAPEGPREETPEGPPENER